MHGVLHVVHGHGGGTEHHARALIDASRGRYRHYLAVAVGDRWQIDDYSDEGAPRAVQLARGHGVEWPAFVGGLCARFAIDLIHLHNISGCRDGLIAALDVLDVPFGYTVHDLNFACPTILFLAADGYYCFEVTDAAVCRACLAAQPAFRSIDIVDWRARHRALLERSAFLVAPSRWAATALERYFPEHAVTVIPHGPPGFATLRGRDVNVVAASQSNSSPLPLPDDDVPTVAVLGAVGPDKGARRLERMAALVSDGRLRVRFVLIGYMDVEHGPWQSDDRVLTVHGRYEPRELPGLLASYRVRLVAFPSAGPETFSFTLSETWAAGLPVIVPPFGALGERVAGTGAGWLWTESEWRDESKMLARILALLAPANAASLAGSSRRARTIPQPTLATMAARTLAIYDTVLARAAAARGRAPGLAR